MSIKSDLDSAKQKLFNEISAAIVKFHSETEIEIKSVTYKANSYANFPDVNFIGFSLNIDVGN